MSKSSKPVAWKNDAGAWLGYIDGALKFSVRERDGEWRLAMPDALGLFAFVRSFADADAAKQFAEAA